MSLPLSSSSSSSSTSPSSSTTELAHRPKTKRWGPFVMMVCAGRRDDLRLPANPVPLPPSTTTTSPLLPLYNPASPPHPSRKVVSERRPASLLPDRLID